ncbi:MAG: GNAT family N-acetyltransferase [Candidatus Hydrogenedentota bacterium]
MTSSFSVEMKRGGVEIIESIKDEWSSLASEGPCDEPFYRPEWFVAQARAFRPGCEICLVLLREEGRLRAVLPVGFELTWRGPLPARTIHSLTNGHSVRYNVIHGAGGDLAKIQQELWNFLRTLRGWDIIELQNVPRGTAAEGLLALARRDGHPAGLKPGSPSPYILLPDKKDGVDAVLARATPSFRGNLRNQMRKLEAMGPVRLERIDRADPEILRVFYELEHGGWKGRAKTSIVSEERTRLFYDMAAEAAARGGYLSLYLLRCGDRVVAMHYGFLHAGRYFSPKVTYDEAYRKCGPGQLIMFEIVRDLIGRGAREFDITGSSAPWKMEWTSNLRERGDCLIFRRSAYGGLLHALLLPLRSAWKAWRRR